MTVLGYIAVIIGTLVFAWAFDRFFGLIFKDKGFTIKDWKKIADKI